MDDNKIKAIIFDLDGMVHLAEGYFSIHTAKRYGVGEEVISEFFKKEFKQCLIGKADLKEEIKHYLIKWNLPLSVEEFLKIWFSYGEFDNEILEFVKVLKIKGIKCVLVTNNEKYRMEHYKEVLSVFDKVIASHNVGFKKPSKEMIDYVLEYLQLEPNEILFCDDKEKFVEKAKEFGFQTWLYDGFEKFKDKLIQ